MRGSTDIERKDLLLVSLFSNSEQCRLCLRGLDYGFQRCRVIGEFLAGIAPLEFLSWRMVAFGRILQGDSGEFRTCFWQGQPASQVLLFLYGTT